MRRFLCVAVALVAATSIATPVRAASRGAYDDVPAGSWAYAGVKRVAMDNTWLRITGPRFLPTRPITRKLLARAMVRAFAPRATRNPNITFTDLPQTDPWFHFANIAASRRWLPATKGAFAPDAFVQKRTLDRALVTALGLTPEAAGFNRITAGGTPIPRTSDLGFLALGSLLRLHYNHPSPNDHLDRLPRDFVSRADAAHALWRAKSLTSWTRTALRRFRTVELPAMTDEQRAAVAFALRWVGYPYVYAGEWHRAVSGSYCCGEQTQGGFDCSGFTWWTLATPQARWDNTHIRPYEGWTIPERSSAQMAKATTERIAAEDVAPLDVLFFDTDRRGAPADRPWEAVDHAGIALGNGLMIHSSGGRAGVAIDRIDSGFWADTFLWGRRPA